MTSPSRTTARAFRRRGSVLVLVMTLLGVLFVTGIVFMANMNFEANLVASDRRRVGKTSVVANVADPLDATLRDSLSVVRDSPFAGVFPTITSGSTKPQSAFAELPGFKSLISPIEPYTDATGAIVFPWITDAQRVFGDGNKAGYGVVNFRLRTDSYNGQEFPPPPEVPLYRVVDADGDGIVDSIQTDLEDIGFSRASLEGLTARLNPESDPRGRVFMGLRVIPHGAMVNLNQSHPNLIANALGFTCPQPGGKTCADLLAVNVRNDPNLGTFRHGPSQLAPNSPYFYPPQQEESLLRRRFFLPPREIMPSLLHGNLRLNPQIATLKFGDADLATILYPPAPITPDNPTGFERVFDGDHRSISLAPGEPFNPTDPNSRSLWEMRMVPETSFTGDPSGNAYDRRHLLTTISHDANLSRGGRRKVSDGAGGTIERDLLDLMREANFAAKNVNFNCDNAPFEYPDYPQTIPNKDEPNPLGDSCTCHTEGPEVCHFDPRKGRLKLSLGWLDKWLDLPQQSGQSQAAQRKRRIAERLIYDTFFMLVRNAAGPDWDDACQQPSDCLTGEFCDLPNPVCRDQVTQQQASLMRISRTAASLTANLIDYMDIDNIPTRIKLRSFDFDDLRRIGGPDEGQTCTELGQDCPGDGCCGRSAGWAFGEGPLKDFPVQYVYGLERQPYITEVTTVSDGTNLKAWAVELFNPYDQPIESVTTSTGPDSYWIYEVDPNDPLPINDANKIPLTFPIISVPPNSTNAPFTVFFTDTGGNGTSFAPPLQGSNAAVHQLPGNKQFTFEQGQVLYLVREYRYPGDDNPTPIVLDQFFLDPNEFINLGNPTAIVNAGGTFSAERIVRNSSTRWTGVVPQAQERPEDNHSLGDWNLVKNAQIRPVEVNFADTGTFTRPNSHKPQLGIAFPTTGSMLLLMRHANRSTDDYDIPTSSGSVINQDLAFTTRLEDESSEIDNGRMPVFDLGGAHHRDPSMTPNNQPGGLDSLPWGQLVFDYFTALPLSNPGPYVDPTPPPGDPNFTPGVTNQQPRVDLEGLRVHGRINLNAAPWTVLAGLPLVPMEKMPEWASDRVRANLQFRGMVLGSDFDAFSIEKPMAQAIVAYRDQRVVNFSGGTTGDYAMVNNGRPWTDAAKFRRGMGFLTVGELANVRHVGAVQGNGTFDPARRIDGAELDLPGSDYLNAVALLVSLGDWVTVRSDVFTTYGVLRGDIDRTITVPDDLALQDLKRQQDVDTRAVRFQETVDRLPTFMGARKPVRIGERVIVPYTDSRND